MATVVIPARFGSTRFYGKVLAKLNGKELIRWVIELACKTKADNVIVATDNDDVRKVCETVSDKVQIVMTPDNIATGSDRVAFVAKNLNDDIVINIQGDEPFLPFALVDEMIDYLSSDSSIDMISSATLIKDDESINNPNNVKVIFDKNKDAIYFSRYPIPYNRDKINTIKHYKHIGIYGYRRTYLLKLNSFERTPLEIAENLEQLRAVENGCKIKMILTDYNPISVDTKEDLIYAEEYIKRGI